jgi:hypothetical protein
MSLPANIDRWPVLWREHFEERAAIMQFDGRLSRDQAELLAESEARREADQENSQFQRRAECAQTA